MVDPGLGATLQDQGRPGWRRFGVPLSGAMDDHAAACANRLLDNPTEAPVLELLMQGAVLRLRRAAWIAITGADMAARVPRWRSLHVSGGETIQFPRQRQGVWAYVAIENGFDAPRWLGSASVYPRGGIGTALRAGDVLHRAGGRKFHLPRHVAGRFASWSDQRNYSAPPYLRVWPGPQWNVFPESERNRFFAQKWELTSQSDRVGYRLKGEPLSPVDGEMHSEPVRVGTIQVPGNGQPIVTMRDGPTVGGYPKLGWIDPMDLSWLVQCCPGQTISFRPADDA